MSEARPSMQLLDLSCCSDLYQHPLMLVLLGESWHPGGLALTRELAKEMKLSREDHLLDVACGRGASALMLAQVFKCRVTGIDSSPEAIQQARSEARRYRLERLVTFTLGDAADLPFPGETFSTALCECSTSLFSDRRCAFRELARVLPPGGRLGVSDVTFRPAALPKPLDLPLAQALCIPRGMGPERYARLMEEAGFSVRQQVDHSEAVARLLERVESLFGVGLLPWPAASLAGGPLQKMEAAVHCALQLVQQGDLGYWTFVARKG